MADLRAELIRAVDHWKWCWDCGAREQECERPCCPDCRHRDAAAARILADERGRELAGDDELREAEQMARFVTERGGAMGQDRMVVLMSEYDERGRLVERWHGRYLELEARTAAELERLRTAIREYVEAPEFDQERFDALEAIAKGAPATEHGPSQNTAG